MASGLTAGEGMLSTGEVGRALGVSINTVKSWIRRGHIRAIRLPSGHYRIPRTEVERLRQGSTPPSAARDWGPYEEWRRAQPAEDPGLDRVLAWIDSVAVISARAAFPPVASPEEKARRVQRMHRSLASLRR